MENLQCKDYIARLQDVLGSLDIPSVNSAIDAIGEAWLSGRQIILLGNGGSALVALHCATDWSKSLFLACGKPFRSISLVDNIGLVTAYANDLSYDDVFVAQLRNILQPGDLVLAISGSGNSENVIRAVAYANAHGNVTVGLTGYDGGRLKPMVKHSVWAPIADMQIAEDIFGIFNHIVLRALVATGMKSSF